MYIKNSLKLVLNNLNISFKAMLFCLIATFVFIFLAYGVSYLGVSVLFKSAEFKQLLTDLRDLFSKFFGVKVERTILFSDSVDAFVQLVKLNIWRLVLTVLMLLVLLFLYNFVLGLCNFTMAVMIDRYMSEIAKTHFIQTFLECLKKSVPFELFLAGLKTLFYTLSFSFIILFTFVIGKLVSLVAFIFAAWVMIALVALFYTFTINFRPLAIQGTSIKDIFKNYIIDKSNFTPIFASNIFNIVLVIYINVTMCFATLGAGIIVSIPLSYLFIVCFQQVVSYTLLGKRYYLDFDNIVIPKKLRSEDEQLLNEVDM